MSMPQICRNCEDAPCLDACPAGAIIRRKVDRYVVLEEERCVHCNMCIMVCPFGAIVESDNKDHNIKHDLYKEEIQGRAELYSINAVAFGRVELYLARKRKRSARLLLGKSRCEDKCKQ